jgi:hypothetical protein
MFIHAKLVAALLAGLVIPAYAANTDDKDLAAPERQRQHLMAKEKCNELSGIKRDQCLTDAKEKYETHR